MQLLEFIEITNLSDRVEVERAKLLCFYHHKETGNRRLTLTMISDLMRQCGFSAPNVSRLKEKLTKGNPKVFLSVKNSKSEFELIPALLQSMEKEYGVYWNDTETVSLPITFYLQR